MSLTEDERLYGANRSGFALERIAKAFERIATAVEILAMDNRARTYFTDEDRQKEAKKARQPSQEA
jgi:hypothetical protein